MHTATIADLLREEFFGATEVAVSPANTSLKALLVQLTDIECSPEDLAAELRRMRAVRFIQGKAQCAKYWLQATFLNILVVTFLRVLNLPFVKVRG